MTITQQKLTVHDVYLDKDDENWELVLVGDEDAAVTVEMPETTALCRLIHQLTHTLPMKRLKEEDKQELIFAMEQILPHIYRNYVLDEYVLD
jgi:hypothetical protein